MTNILVISERFHIYIYIYVYIYICHKANIRLYPFAIRESQP